MADKKLNNVSTLTSSTLASNDYAYVEDVSASNEQKKVTITDLAKVVGEQTFIRIPNESTYVKVSLGMTIANGVVLLVAAAHPDGGGLNLCILEAYSNNAQLYIHGTRKDIITGSAMTITVHSSASENAFYIKPSKAYGTIGVIPLSNRPGMVFGVTTVTSTPSDATLVSAS